MRVRLDTRLSPIAAMALWLHASDKTTTRLLTVAQHIVKCIVLWTWRIAITEFMMRTHVRNLLERGPRGLRADELYRMQNRAKSPFDDRNRLAAYAELEHERRAHG